MNRKALYLLDDLEQLNAKKATLFTQLKRSLMIQEIWPEAFDHGKATTQAVGDPRRTITWTITNGNGDCHEMDLLAVPVELWSEQIIDSINDVPGHATKYWRILHDHKRAQS